MMMMMTEQAVVVDDDDDQVARPHRQLLLQRNKMQADTHEPRKPIEAHVINPANGKHSGRQLKVKKTTIDSPPVDSREKEIANPKPVHDEKEESVPEDAPQGYERPVYPSPQAYIAPISSESPSQSPPQASPAAPVSPAPVVYQSPTPIAAIPYTLTPQVQPIEYVPVRSRRVKSRPHVIEEIDDDDDEYTPKRKSRKVVYVIRKSKKQQQPTYTDEDEEDDSGS